MMPWHEQKLEEMVADGLMGTGKMGFGARSLRLLQRPFQKENSVNLPRFLNPAGDRKLPSLAPKSFRQMWTDGDLDKDQ